MSIKKLSTLKSPIWIKIWNIPFDLLSVEGIGYIVSAVGKSLCLDKATEERRMIDFAKNCVEVNSTDDLPEAVEVEKGDSFTVSIEYPGKPLKCSSCNDICHLSKFCNQIVRKWVPKNLKQRARKYNLLHSLRLWLSLDGSWMKVQSWRKWKK